MGDLKKGYRRAVLVWMAMVLSIFIYALVVELMRMNPALLERPSPFRETDAFRYVFLFLATTEFFVIGFIRNHSLSGRSVGNRSSDRSHFSSKITKLLSISIITNALCESVAISGLLLFFLTKNPFDFYLFLAWSVVYFLFYFPRYDQWEGSFRGSEEKGSLGIFARN